MRFLNYAGGVFILLLLALGCKPEAKRSRVLVIQSFRWDDKNYLELNSDIRKELRKNRVNADIRTFISIVSAIWLRRKRNGCITLSIRYVFGSPTSYW